MIYCNLFMHMQNIRGPAMIHVARNTHKTFLSVPNFAQTNRAMREGRGRWEKWVDKQILKFKYHILGLLWFVLQGLYYINTMFWDICHSSC